MSKYTKTNITQLSSNEQAAINAINKNLSDIQNAIEDTVSRSGQTPSHMTSDLDMNGKRIINCPAPTSDTDLVRRVDVAGDINTIQQLTLTATTAASEAESSAELVRDIIEDRNVFLIAEDLALGDDSTIKKTADNMSSVTSVGSNISNVNAVASNETNINAVNSNKTNINAVAGDLTNIGTVATDISSVNTVSTNISSVTAVAGNATNINAVNSNKTNINTVAGISSAVSGVASIASDVTAVNSNKTNIDTVAGSISDVNDVADITAAVSTVAGISSSVSSVASNSTNINKVATDISNVNTVGGSISNVNAVAGNSTNINSVAGNSTNINTVAADSANIATVVNNITAINDAPTYAAQAKQWAIGDPSEPANGSAKYWAERAHVYTEGVLHEDLISNCITEIPQDIKLELSNGTLTLKSGSVIIYPDGTQAQTTSDKTYTITDNGTFPVTIAPNNNLARFNNTYSGSTEPSTPAGLDGWYDTTNNVVKRWTGSAWQSGFTLPICVVTVSNGAISSIDKVFNGAGYIGHHAFVLPGVKGLEPYGKNEDGTLKYYLYEQQSLAIVELANNIRVIGSNGSNSVAVWSYYHETDDINTYEWQYSGDRVYDRSTNILYALNSSAIRHVTPVVFCSVSGTSVTKFDVRQPVRLATTEMTDNLQTQIDTKQDTLVSGTNIKTINSTTVLGSGNFALVNQSLSNLDSTGQMVVDTQNGTISNCILDIPQDINITLSSGTLTLKSGSIITVPDGTQIQTTDDKTLNLSSLGNGTHYVIYRTHNNTLQSLSTLNLKSGSSLPETGTLNEVFFNTTESKYYYYSSTGWQNWAAACPLGIVNASNGVVTIEQVFNGFGYIGGAVFVLPGVKGLIPAGLKTDGTMKSQLLNVTSLMILTSSLTRPGRLFCNNSALLFAISASYNEEENRNYNYGYSPYCDCGELVYNNGVVESLTPKKPVRLATTEMLDTKANDSDVVKLAGNQTITGDKTFSGAVALGSSATATTQSAGDNSTSVATTAYADTAVSNKIQLVSTLPATPTNGVLYVIPE